MTTAILTPIVVTDPTSSKTTAVTFAAGLLDEDRPNWHVKLRDIFGTNLERLEVSNPYACVLFGVYGNYGTGHDRLFLNRCRNLGEMIMMGNAFACDEPQNPLLRELWLDEIRRRAE